MNHGNKIINRKSAKFPRRLITQKPRTVRHKKRHISCAFFYLIENKNVLIFNCGMDTGCHIIKRRQYCRGSQYDVG